MSAMSEAWDHLATTFTDLQETRRTSALWSQGKGLKDLIDALWSVAQDHALTDGKTYEAIRAAIEYLEVIQDAALDQ